MKYLFRIQQLTRRLPVLFALAAAVLFATILPCGHSSAAETLTWQDCVQEALARHPELAVSRESLNQALADRDIAKSPGRPQVAANASSSRGDRDDAAATTSHSFGISARQMLYDGKKTTHQVSAAEAAVTSRQYTHDVTSSRIRLQLRTAFVDLLHARELLNISEEIARRRRQNLELVRLRHDAGREHRGSLLSARANVAQAEYEIRSARREVSLAMWRLARELGRDGTASVTVAGELSVPPADAGMPDFEALTADNPFLKELIAQKEVSLASRDAVKSGFFPQVYADASAGRSDSDWPPDRDQWSVGLSVSVPLFEGGSRFAEMRKAGARVRQAEAQATSGRAETLHTLRDAWIAFQNAVDRVAVGRAFVEASEERAKIAQVEYSNGLITFDTWAIIEDDLERDRKNYLTFLANALVAEAYWVQAKGVTLEHDLEKN
ncbi:TolC family protein [Desulfosudis oleivorans]|uniref:Outer membrane efflux protein n=1 Tax=Desulfosudis oleivorans (strain DSM 6200 / JCM 39069 / Hxd3) TaxID=96561 RepID=A9A0D3_DESOH|nr:TolC family protein [Desulfosudis oleivorans]ABW67433.1 outer membrane efflux protein [Desulfosudis oleivorans Hxd3]